MKKINLYKVFTHFILLVAVVNLTLSCEENSCPTCPGSENWHNNNNAIEGSGNIISVERSLPIFNSINHTTVGQVNITYGEIQEVLITSDDNIQPYIKTEVQNGTLIISIDCDCSLSDFTLTLDIVLTELKELTVNSAGNINSMNTFIADEVYLYLNSAGNINLDISATTLYSNLSSAGNLFLNGKTQNHYCGLYSAGNLHAYKLETDTTRISINSAGNAFVNVVNFMDATLTSLGSLFYIGNPQISQTTSSIGKVVDSN